MTGGNLFAALDNLPSREVFEELARGKSFLLERIVSTGQSTRPGEWYDQEQDEWVVLLSGEAGLLIEGEAEARRMVAGDYVLLGARTRHRVEWTASPTVWLALHFEALPVD